MFILEMMDRNLYTLVMKKNLIFSCIIMMFLGLVVYIFFNKTAFISRLIDNIFPTPTIHFPESFFVNIIRGYAADFLWSAAFTLVIQAILEINKKRIWYLLFCSLLGILYELLQFLGVATGSADIWDILTYLCGSAFGILIILGGKYYEKE